MKVLVLFLSLAIALSCTDHSQCPDLQYSKCHLGACIPCDHHDQCTNSFNPICGPQGHCIPCVDGQNQACTSELASKCGGPFGCVPCQEHEDCQHIPGKPKCQKEDTDSDGFNDLFYCAACTVPVHCQSFDNSNCDAGVCSPCTDSSQCESPNNTCDNGICKSNCVSGDDCTDPLFGKCDNGTCKRCDGPNQCKNGEVCNLATQQCEDCKADVECFDEKHKCDQSTHKCVVCDSDIQCSSNVAAKCDSGQCVACDSHSQCSDPQFAQCFEGVCIPCSLSSQCESGEECYLGECRSNCTTHDQCVINQFSQCQNGFCIPCDRNDQCEHENFSKCYKGQCIGCESARDCLHIEGKGICSQGSCVACNDNSDCGDSSSCVDGECQNGCSDGTVYCTSYMAPVCLNDDCYSCETNQDCSKFSITKPICYDGQCRMCLNHFECHTPERSQCLDNRCEACDNDDQCQDGMNSQCVEGVCQSGCQNHSECQSHQLSKCVNQICYPCDRNSQCSDPEYPICAQGECVKGCQRNDDCPLDQARCHNMACSRCLAHQQCKRFLTQSQCKFGVCQACESHNHCTDGVHTRCNNGECVVPCQSHEDCSGLDESKCDGDQVCVPCADDGQCTDGSNTVCVTGECKSNCVGNDDCTDLSLKKCSGGQCLPCDDDSQCPSENPQCSNGVCTGCADDSQCKYDLRYPKCDNLKCICTGNESCTRPNESRCQDGSCGGCQSNEDCGHIKGMNACNTNTNTCQSCVIDSDCPSSQKCESSRAKCVECLANEDCPDNLVCNWDNTCVICTEQSESNCPVETPKCVDNDCFECRADSDCASGSLCNRDYRCTQNCSDDTECQNPTLNFCDPQLDECVECVTDQHCSDNFKCQDSLCVQCRTTIDCPSGQVCSPLFECSECVSNSDCIAPTPLCSDEFTCQRECLIDQQCPPLRPFCHPDTFACRECSTPMDCPHERPKCTQGQCTPECIVDADCTDQLSYCLANRCVECTSEQSCGAGLTCNQNIGLCGTACTDDSQCTDSFCEDDICVECRYSSDCSNNQQCRNYKCYDSQCQNYPEETCLTETAACFYKNPGCIDLPSSSDCSLNTFEQCLIDFNCQYDYSNQSCVNFETICEDDSSCNGGVCENKTCKCDGTFGLNCQYNEQSDKDKHQANVNRLLELPNTTKIQKDQFIAEMLYIMKTELKYFDQSLKQNYIDIVLKGVNALTDDSQIRRLLSSSAHLLQALSVYGDHETSKTLAAIAKLTAQLSLQSVSQGCHNVGAPNFVLMACKLGNEDTTLTPQFQNLINQGTFSITGNGIGFSVVQIGQEILHIDNFDMQSQLIVLAGNEDETVSINLSFDGEFQLYEVKSCFHLFYQMDENLGQTKEFEIENNNQISVVMGKMYMIGRKIENNPETNEEAKEEDDDEGGAFNFSLILINVTVFMMIYI